MGRDLPLVVNVHHHMRLSRSQKHPALKKSDANQLAGLLAYGSLFNSHAFPVSQWQLAVLLVILLPEDNP